MPTINQLIRKGRAKKAKFSKSPVLGFGWDRINRIQ
jgi:ribosomal protein S12